MRHILASLIAPFYILNKYRNFSIFLLILAISISPRIHIGMLQYGKIFDLRYEDFLIPLITISLFIYIMLYYKKIYTSPLGKPIMLYLSLAFISTSAGLLSGWIEPTRAFFFYTKEVEFFLIFFVTLNFIKDYKDLKIAISAFLIGGFLNVSYVLYQFLSGDVGGMQYSAYKYYGISMIGESGAGVTGNYFSLLLFLSITLIIFVKGKVVKLISTIVMLLSILGLIGSMSRVSIWGTVFVLPVYLFSIFGQKINMKKIIPILIILILLFPTFIYFYGETEKLTPSAKRIVNIENIEKTYITERVEDVYTDYFKVFFKSPVIGLGKSITGQQSIPGISLTRFYGEAHNHYLRVLVEMGVVGLSAFLYILILILKFSYRVFKNNFSPLGKATGLVCFIYTIFLMVSSLGQDVFVMARTTELYWILVGLVMLLNANRLSKIDTK